MAAGAQQQEANLEELTESYESAPTHEDIALLAYALWQERGCPEGSSDEDWFNAEQELKARSNA